MPDEYNPAAGLRGFTSKAEPPDDDDKLLADNAGKSTRQQCFSVMLRTSYSHVSLLYGHFTGTPTMDLKESVIEIAGGGRVLLKEGWAEPEGGFTVTIRGKRLAKVYKEICEGKRQDIHPCKDGNDDKPFVELVGIEAVREEDYERKGC